MAYVSYDPWKDKVQATIPEMSDGEIEDIVSAAGKAFVKWRSVAIVERCGLLRALAGHVKSQRSEIAEMMASEMGKPVSQGLAEADKCALLCNWSADNAAAMLQPERRPSSARESYVCYEPQGIILGIMPWNFPFWQVFRFIVPVLTGGNAALLKHASNVPQCAIAIEEIVTASGYPDGLFRTIFPSHDQVYSLISSPLVRGVSLTGSNAAGSSIAAAAGRNLKKVVMELGGSDPFIVFPDASLEKAVEAAFLPTLVDQVPSAAPLSCEEVFGPVAPLFSFESVAEAVKMANNTLFGLGASVWTSDEKLALEVAGQIDTGTVAINGFVRSEPGLPFGGVKDSGFGRELAVEGMREFLNIKTISIF